MKLNALIGQSRFIVGPNRRDVPLLLPPIEFGNVLPIELRAWTETANGEFVAEDLSTYQISLLLGKPNSRAALGFWQLTTTVGTSKPIKSRATAQEVQSAMTGALSPCIVEGGEGSYIVTLIQPGVWALPSASFQGNTLSNVLVFQITPGTTQTPAQYRIEVLEVAPARIVPANWTTGNTTPVNAFTQTSGRLWSLALSPDVDNGFFNLTIDGVTTDLISFNGGAYNIAVALSAAGKPAQVAPDNLGRYWVNFSQNVTVASTGGNLVILPFSQGNLDLTSTGVRELLDGLQFADVKLSVILVKDGTTITCASADVMLTMPVNQPATITIDAPLMAGLTFAVSDDQTILHVYQNGILIGDCPLQAP